MDKNVDQYCTFEANQFALQDQTHLRPTEMTLGSPNIPQVRCEEETEDNFFNMDYQKNAFAIRGTDYFGQTRLGKTGSIYLGDSNKERYTKTSDLDSINQEIEAKANQLKQRIHEAMK